MLTNRRDYHRFQVPNVTAIVRVPESGLDYYFHVDNLSRFGMALATRTLEGFPLEVGRVLDIQAHMQLGVVVCRGYVARLLSGADGQPAGVGVHVYSFSPDTEAIWSDLIDNLEDDAAAGTPAVADESIPLCLQ